MSKMVSVHCSMRSRPRGRGISSMFNRWAICSVLFRALNGRPLRNEPRSAINDDRGLRGKWCQGKWCQFIYPWGKIVSVHLSLRGRPRGRGMSSIFKRLAICWVHSEVPSGRPLRNEPRTVINSPWFCAAHTLARHRLRRSASVRPSSSHSGNGETSGSARPSPWQGKLDHRYSAGSVTSLARSGLASMYRRTTSRCASS